jgi:hypothetical protein
MLSRPTPTCQSNGLSLSIDGSARDRRPPQPAALRNDGPGLPPPAHVGRNADGPQIGAAELFVRTAQPVITPPQTHQWAALKASPGKPITMAGALSLRSRLVVQERE